jgi:hypothetical protein
MNLGILVNRFAGFSVRGSSGAVTPLSITPGARDEGRFRQVTEGYSTWLGNSPPQGHAGGEAAVPEYCYVGINATLYAKGEAIAVNRLNTDTLHRRHSVFGQRHFGQRAGHIK